MCYNCEMQLSDRYISERHLIHQRFSHDSTFFLQQARMGFMSGRGYVLNRHVSSRRNPEHQGQPSLFDGVDDEIEHNNLTDDSKATNFLSRFHEFIDPVSKYSSYFETSAMGMDHIFIEV